MQQQHIEQREREREIAQQKQQKNNSNYKSANNEQKKLFNIVVKLQLIPSFRDLC